MPTLPPSLCSQLRSTLVELIIFQTKIKEFPIEVRFIVIHLWNDQPIKMALILSRSFTAADIGTRAPAETRAEQG
jgi:hypothetical protein